MTTGPLIFLVAGEASGDVLGASLMQGLKALTGGQVRFAGVGGPRMEEQGLESLFPQEDLAVFGLAELLPGLPRLIRRLGLTVAAARRLRPDAVVTIDAPDFSFRVAKRLRAAVPDIPLIHYVAPTVWAWRPGRAARIARFLDGVLTLLPFEPPYFEAAGLPARFVGHPAVETGAGGGDGAAFRARHAITPETPLLCVLPGSRGSELSTLLPIFRDTVHRLAATRPQLRLVIPTLAPLRDRITRAVADWPGAPIVTTTDADKYDAFAAADAALACSGTVALELGLAGVPAVIAYRVHPLTYRLYRRLIRVRHVSLVNILLDRPLVPELLQDQCMPGTLAAATAPLLDDPAAGEAQRRVAHELRAMLGGNDTAPGQKAAGAVLELIAARGRRRGGT